jgi:hypothetical protein
VRRNNWALTCDLVAVLVRFETFDDIGHHGLNLRNVALGTVLLLESLPDFEDHETL